MNHLKNECKDSGPGVEEAWRSTLSNDGAEQPRLMELRWLLISAAVLINYLPATQMFLYLGESVDLFDFVCPTTEMDGSALGNFFFCFCGGGHLKERW